MEWKWYINLIDHFHIVVGMHQTVQVSRESTLSQRDYNRGGNLLYAAYQKKGPGILYGNVSIKNN